MKRPPLIYSAQELAWIESNKSMLRREGHAAFCKEFGRVDVSFQHYNSLCKRKGWLTGRDGRLKPGNVPINKGQKCEPGTGGLHPNARKTQFKRGQLPHNTKHLGHERLTKDGYIEVSVAQTNPYTGFDRHYVQKHRYLWEQLNGPVPEGYCLKSLDGDRLNTDPSNWEAIPRAILPRLNGRFGMAYDRAEPEVKPSILVVAKLKHAVNQVTKRVKA